MDKNFQPPHVLHFTVKMPGKPFLYISRGSTTCQIWVTHLDRLFEVVEKYRELCEIGLSIEADKRIFGNQEVIMGTRSHLFSGLIILAWKSPTNLL
jgi:hypothetical protein